MTDSERESGGSTGRAPGRRRTVGPVEKAVRAHVRALGVLDSTRAVAAASAIHTAMLVDAETDGSKHASLTRELRQHMPSLEIQPMRTQEDKPKGDNVSSLVDKVNRKRRGLAG